MDTLKYVLAGAFLVISMFFAWRSFYGMRIGGESEETEAPAKKDPPKAEKKEEKKEEAKAEKKEEAKVEAKADDKKEESASAST